MPDVVGIRFKEASKIYSFDPAGNELKPGDEVIVETSRGQSIGEVVFGPRTISDDEVVSPLRPVLRVATDEDRVRAWHNEERAQKAIEICEEKVGKHGLEMQIVDAEYAFDGGQLIFYFTADGRVDFRELVRDLAGTFHTRIELRQIGVRDEAKMIGGIGPCGRECCCATFLTEFSPISIRMAKRQNLSLNPTKISGLCGRLMCCLQFEDPTYKNMQNNAYKPGTKVVTDDGVGKVVRTNALDGRVQVRMEDNETVTYDADEVSRSRE
ncbi:MAG: stage 0 sporulation family protein [Bacillota bacterium]